MKLHSELIAIEDLTDSQREQMLALMDRYYFNVDQDNFEKDLSEKQWCITLTDSQSKKLCGFSTQMLISKTINRERVTVLYSGDTVLDREYWGDHSLASLWGQFALELIDSIEADHFYWLLLSKGYRTYRYLPVFFHEYYPNKNAPLPNWEKTILDQFVGSKYPSNYDANSGIVVASDDKDRLRPGVADVTEDRLLNEDIQYFQRSNPGHTQGDELCCIAPLTRDNFTKAAYRVIGVPNEKLPLLNLQ